VNALFLPVHFPVLSNLALKFEFREAQSTHGILHC